MTGTFRVPGARLARVRKRLLDPISNRSDGGFILLEAMIAITVITIIMSAIGVEFVSSVASTSQQRTQQLAIQVADSEVEQIRSYHATDLLLGRTLTADQTQLTNAPTAVQPWLAQMDAASGTGTAQTLPISGTTPSGTSYTVTDYLGWCYIPTTGSTNCVKLATAGSASVKYLRAVVAVTWKASRCGSNACTYVTSTLVSTATDPIFRVNQALPTAPIVVNPGAQTVAVGDVVSLQLKVQDGTGVPPFAWLRSAGSFPTGLDISPTGLVSGTVGGSAGSLTSTVQATDAFVRTDTQDISWTVEPAVGLTDPGAQASTIGSAITALTLSGAGGDGAAYTFTDPTSSLPAGLSISSAGKITGTPTTVGTSTVKVNILDKSGRSGAGTFSWTVGYPPLVASNPGAQVSTVSTAITPTVTLNASGGSGSYSWSATSLPAGLTLSSSGTITGTPTALGTSSVTLTVTDIGVSPTTTKTVSVSWAVVAKPTLTAPANQASSVGTTVSLALTTSCPNTPCSYGFVGSAPSGLSITSAGVISGTVGGGATTYSGIKITATDGDSATATSGTFNWTVNNPPTITTPANQTTMRSGTVSLNVSASGGTGSLTYSASNLPSWLTLNSTTGKITGTAPTTNSTTTGIRVTVTDSTSAQTASSSFTWNVTNLANSFNNQTTYKSTAVNLDLDNYSSGGTSPYTYTASGLPSWLSLNSSTGVISGTSPSVAANSTTTTSGITATVTDSKGAVISISPFNWYVTDMTWAAPATVSTAQGTNLAGTTAASYLTGGSGTKTYTATNIPTGLSMSSTGAITGSTNTKGTWNVTLTATDSAGATLSTALSWTVS